MESINGRRHIWRRFLPRLAVFLFFLLPAFSTGFVPAAESAPVVTIAHDFLDMEKPFGAAKGHTDRLNALIEKARTRLTVKENYTSEEALKLLGQIHLLLKEEGFVFKNNFLLCKGLDSRAIDCDNYCALYTAIAESMKIPMIPVYAPNHSFMRFYFSDGSYLNWETLMAKHLPNSYYVKKLQIAEVSVSKGVYLKSLQRKEFHAVEYNNIGAYLMTARRYREAVSYFTKALELHSVFSGAYHNRGSCLYALKRLKEAREDLARAVALDPYRAPTYNTLGDVCLDLKESDMALKCYTASVKLDPTNYVPYNSIALIMKARGKEELAQKWLKKSQEIKARYGK